MYIPCDSQESIIPLSMIKDVEADDGFFDNKSVNDFSWCDVHVTAKSRAGESTPIVQGNSGSLRAQEVLALMGPSGSGKTTLLNVLARRSRLAHTGSTCINGSQVTTTTIRQLSAYVEQEDVQLGGLTVAENVEFTARLAAGLRAKSICKDRCRDVLNALGLANQKDMLVSPALKAGISGGQKRRLNLATALVTGPKILFLDEPTSGLDSVASHQVVKFLRDFARRHKILIIIAIHQPSSSTFDLFDKVMLLSRGRTCYFGPRADVVPYFDSFLPVPLHTNPAEHMLEVVNTDFGGARQLADITRRWEATANSTTPRAKVEGSHIDQEGRPVSGFQATAILLHRGWIKAYRDPLVYLARAFVTVGLALVIGKPHGAICCPS